MERDFYNFLFELRASGFRHTTAEDLLGYFSDFKAGAKSFSQDFDLTDSKISSTGERGFLSGYKLNDIRNFIIGCCFFASNTIVEEGGNAEHAYGLSDYYMNKLDDAHNLLDYQEIFAQMITAFSELSQTLQKDEFSTSNRDVKKAIHFIYQNLYSPISAKDVAAFIEKNPSYLSQIFLCETGFSLHQFILHEKVKEAKLILRNTNKSIQNIAEALGFSSAPHFNRIFKKIEGQTPGDYRKSPHLL